MSWEPSTEQAIVAWVNTFESLPHSCSAVSDLTDGILLLHALHAVSPLHFDLSSLSPASSNWALSSSNLKKLLRMIEDYYRAPLSKQLQGIDEIDASAIARYTDPDSLTSLVELVVGAAVLCENKAEFISKIFILDEVSQSVLKQFVEAALGRTRELEPDSGNSARIGADAAEEELIRMREMVKHLQSERQRLTDQVTSLQHSNDTLSSTSQSLRVRVQQFEDDQAALEGSDRSRSQAAAVRAEALQAQLDETQRELDVQTVATDTLRQDLRSSQSRLETMHASQMRLEMENHQLFDELDVARDKASKLAKAEAQLDKYQKRLEELAAIKRENKELVEKLDQYIEKIHELESANKNIATMTKLVDQYKDRAVDMEREKFQAVSALQMQQHEYTRMSRELDEAQDARRFLEEELSGARSEIEQHITAAAELQASVNEEKAASEAFETESLTSLREKLKLLEIELKDYRSREERDGRGGRASVGSESDSSHHTSLGASSPQAKPTSSAPTSPNGSNNANGTGAPGSATATAASATTIPSDMSYKDLASLLASTQAELALALSVKLEREDMLMTANLQISELQAEAQRTQRAMTDLEKSISTATAANAQLKEQLTSLQKESREKEGELQRQHAQTVRDAQKELKDQQREVVKELEAKVREGEQKLALSENTLRLLEEGMREKEGLVSRLEQDKTKLENFSKSTLLSFKEKYMKALKAINEEKRSLEERLASLTETNERNLVTSRREERLMLSAFYEIGVKIMDANISSKYGSSPSALSPMPPPSASSTPGHGQGPLSPSTALASATALMSPMLSP